MSRFIFYCRMKKKDIATNTPWIHVFMVSINFVCFNFKTRSLYFLYHHRATWKDRLQLQYFLHLWKYIILKHFYWLLLLDIGRKTHGSVWEWIHYICLKMGKFSYKMGAVLSLFLFYYYRCWNFNTCMVYSFFPFLLKRAGGVFK